MQDPSSQSTNAPAAKAELCEGVLPVWVRHIAASRAQSEVAVTDMLKAFADIAPHINMAERQSREINDALSHPVGGVTGLVQACEQELQPWLQDARLPAEAQAAMGRVLDMVRESISAMAQISKPFQQETLIVAQHVERMYVGFQYQDRISQILALLEGDMGRLLSALTGGADVPELSAWLAHLESQYAMAEQHADHKGESAGEQEATFF